ncbi:unnamed protein product [Angiostrongylus costaricensis]|uniref:Uncharacterized protein n=1 Tax=Angiostrongylus costaricensis TaxID=334426 RepID=A0A0R3PG52_ANGCS|nr:unnamed protein product [Angiostrongylus costaricensis]
MMIELFLCSGMDRRRSRLKIFYSNKLKLLRSYWKANSIPVLGLPLGKNCN